MHGDDLDDDLWWRNPADDECVRIMREMAEAEAEQMRPFWEQSDRETRELIEMMAEADTLPRDVAEVLGGIPPTIEPGWLK